MARLEGWYWTGAKDTGYYKYKWLGTDKDLPHNSDLWGDEQPWYNGYCVAVRNFKTPYNLAARKCDSIGYLICEAP